MAERTLIVDHLKLGYIGLFNASEVYNLISSFFFEKGWDWYEKMNQEIITPQGKQVKMILEPWKSVSDYNKLIIAIKIVFMDLKDVEIEYDQKMIHLNKGEVKIIFDGYILSDRKKRWSSKPLFWFLSILIEKYFFKEHFTKLETWIKSDVNDLQTKIKTYLNACKYMYQNTD